jgi:hypothetical protein
MPCARRRDPSGRRADPHAMAPPPGVGWWPDGASLRLPPEEDDRQGGVFFYLALPCSAGLHPQADHARRAMQPRYG